nr:retrovirus-related Pol polyprotein from transposon TNT 1-94 [Tanacetum cinerariifolium]
MTIIETKWVFRNKLDKNGIVSRNKARLVAQGYNQQEGIDYDETYAPVARLESIRIILAYVCALDFKLFQIYVKSAFLNDFINEEVYVAQRLGFIDFEKLNHVYKLKKALYDLKQAPKAWHYALRITDPEGTDIETVVYVDSDHAGYYVDRKSTSGICKFVGCCLTSWFLKKQTALAISTTEAEYTQSNHGKKRPREPNTSSSSTTLNHPYSSHLLDDTLDENDDESFHSNSSSLLQNISSSSNVVSSVRQNPPRESHNLNTYLSETINLQT